jgi:hypothetical protein
MSSKTIFCVLATLVFSLICDPKNLARAAQGFDDACVKASQEISKQCDHIQFARQCLMDQLTTACAKHYGTATMNTDPVCRNESMKAAEHCAPAMVARQRECLKKNLTPACWKQFEAIEIDLEAKRKLAENCSAVYRRMQERCGKWNETAEFKRCAAAFEAEISAACPRNKH